MRAFLIPSLVVVGALPGITALAGEPHRTIDASRALSAATPPAASGTASDFVATPTPPDPAPLSAHQQWVFDLRWDRGDVWLLGVRGVELPAARVTPRAMGRFALELYEGPALLERVRFDFPLLGAPEPRGAPSFSARLRTRIGVFFPATALGKRLDLLDRATGRRWSIPWPPARSPEAAEAPADARALPPSSGDAVGRQPAAR